MSRDESRDSRDSLSLSLSLSLMYLQRRDEDTDGTVGNNRIHVHLTHRQTTQRTRRRLRGTLVVELGYQPPHAAVGDDFVGVALVEGEVTDELDRELLQRRAAPPRHVRERLLELPLRDLGQEVTADVKDALVLEGWKEEEGGGEGGRGRRMRKEEGEGGRRRKEKTLVHAVRGCRRLQDYHTHGAQHNTQHSTAQHDSRHPFFSLTLWFFSSAPTIIS